MSQYNEDVPDESEQLDQLETNRSLTGEDLADPLDQGYAPPDRWSAAEGFGNTVEEQRQGESLEQRLAQEEPDIAVEDDLPAPQTIDSDTMPEDEVDPELARGGEVGDERAGRLVDIDGGEGTGVADHEPELLGTDVGIDGAAAGAEEAAVHVITDDVTTLPDAPEL